MTVIPQNLGIVNAYLWCATARPLLKIGDSGDVVGVADEAARTATTCFMNLLKTREDFQTTSADPWEWRRICFLSRGAINQAVIPFTQYTDFQPGTDFLRTRVNRPVKPLTVAQLNLIESFVFRGVRTLDYGNQMAAKTDTENVCVVYDKFRKINSGNSVGVFRQFTCRHFMKKNLKYLDTEQAETEISENFSTTSKIGMGDYYVLDLFRTTAVGTGTILWNPESTLYWHEK